MNDIIIHISDLHITDSTGVFGPVNKYTLFTSKNEDSNFSLVDSMIERIKEYKHNNCYLIITGDISNIAEEVEFDIAYKLLNKLITDLKIDSKNILLIPGDHEIHRQSIYNALRLSENKGKKGFELNKDKYSNFLPFYKKIKREEFDYEKLIFDQITIDNILILGVNSNYKVGQDSSDGFLPLEQFDKELGKIVSDNTGKHILLALHHNISGTYQDKRTGQWVVENRKDLIPYFLKHNVKCIFHGNEHTPKSEKLDSSEIYVSDSGALAGINPLGSLKIYEIEANKSSIDIKNNIIQLRKINAISEPNNGDWMTVSANESSCEMASFNIYKGNSLHVSETLDIPSESVDEGNKVEKEIAISSEERIFYNNESIQKQLYNIVRDKKLFHSGHFHWSESSRSHNWIDVSKLIEDKEDLSFVKNAIVNLIEAHSLSEDCDLMIGLGTEGNIISSKASIKYDIPYTLLPYSFRYDKSHEFEKKLNFDNSKGDYKKIIIISDVINDGRTIRKLIGDYEKDFFEKVEQVTVISLFYTGHEVINKDILNYDKLPKDHEITTDFKINNIDFFAVSSLKVEKCPYGSNYKKECLIYKDELSCVNLFYDDNYK
jgi:orotate phosphoribosyltransferase